MDHIRSLGFSIWLVNQVIGSPSPKEILVIKFRELLSPSNAPNLDANDIEEKRTWYGILLAEPFFILDLNSKNKSFFLGIELAF